MVSMKGESYRSSMTDLFRDSRNRKVLAERDSAWSALWMLHMFEALVFQCNGRTQRPEARKGDRVELCVSAALLFAETGHSFPTCNF